MGFLPDLEQSPFVLLGKIKTRIEKELKKPIEDFSLSVDTVKGELQLNADGQSKTEKDIMMIYVMKKGIKTALGKKTPDFARCTIFYKDDYIHITLIGKDGSVTTKSITKDEN